MKKHLFGVAILTSLLLGGIASAQTIDQIQQYNPTTGATASPYAGQTVTVSGIVVERQQYSGGSGYIWNAGDGGLAFYSTAGATTVVGDHITITGSVSAFSGEIQLATPSWVVNSSGNTPVPVVMTITQALSDYENVGNYTRAIGVVTAVNANSNFFMTDGTDTIQIYIDSTTGINLGSVAIGDTYQVTAPLVNFNGTIELKPVFQAALVENPLGDTVPVIANVTCSNWAPTTSTPIVVSASITDNIGVSSATLYYRNSDGVTPGSWSSTPMTLSAGIYSGTIPATHPQSQVDFYVRATDTAAQVSYMPGNAPTGFTSVAIGFTSIYAMQTVHPDSTSQSNNYLGKFLNIKGVVTAAGASQVGAASKLVVQELAKNPATSSYAFGGVLVFESSAKYPYYQGDVVEVGGHGDEYYGLTEMIPHNGDAINVVGFGHALPEPAIVHTRVLADDNAIIVDGNGNLGEAWEDVWVKTFNSTVIDTVGLGKYREFMISDTGARADSLMVGTFAALAYTPIIGNVITVTSFVDYAYGEFMLHPIDDSYLTFGAAAVDNNVPTVESAGGFRSVHPNPFNPVTNIKFVVNRAELVQLNVYNIRGEKVRTLLQDRIPANEYTVMWDGTDDSGQGVASGSYFARLRIGKEVMQVRQMQLVK